ncbi:MAG: VPLPA-CTERM sorting domain-containing protein [Pseudomonadota bacterium]
MKYSIIFAAALFSATTARAATTELLTNGSFEADDLPDNTIGVLFAPVTGWTDLAFLFDGDPSGFWPDQGNTGRQYGDIGNNSTSMASQSFTVGAGDILHSITWFDNSASTGPASSQYTVRLLDQFSTILEEQNYTASHNATTWGSESLNLGQTYGAGTYTLTMFGTTGFSTNDTLVDDVSALSTPAPVPLPASFPLLFAGICGVAVAARRRCAV